MSVPFVSRKILVGDLFRAGRTYVFPVYAGQRVLQGVGQHSGLEPISKGVVSQLLQQPLSGDSLGRVVIVNRGDGRFEVVEGGELLVLLWWILLGLKEKANDLLDRSAWQAGVVGPVQRVATILEWNSRCQMALEDDSDSMGSYCRKVLKRLIPEGESSNRLLAMVHCFRYRLWIEQILVENYRGALEVYDLYHDPLFPVSEVEVLHRRQLQLLAAEEEG